METLVVSHAFRDRVRLLADRLGVFRLVVEPKWRSFAGRLELPAGDNDVGVALVVGTPATVLRHARTAADAADGFGFVMPVARLAKPWQRGHRWRDDVSLQLWEQGFTPINLDRLLVEGDGATIEFVIGDARRTPVTP